MTDRTQSKEITRARWLSNTLDRRFVDPILGLVFPGVGDAFSSLLGIYLIVVAWRQERSKVLLARMLINLGVDSAIGAIPIAGDLFDFFFQANRKNLALLERPPRPKRDSLADTLFVGVALLFFLATLAVPVLLLTSLVAWFFQTLPSAFSIATGWR